MQKFKITRQINNKYSRIKDRTRLPVLKKWPLFNLKIYTDIARSIKRIISNRITFIPILIFLVLIGSLISGFYYKNSISDQILIKNIVIQKNTQKIEKLSQEIKKASTQNSNVEKVKLVEKVNDIVQSAKDRKKQLVQAASFVKASASGLIRVR